MARVELRQVWKRFGDIVAVEDFSLSASDGEFIVFVGPSGCGKTTTMRIIAGLEVATEGQVLFDGKDVSDELPHNRDVAMVFQNYALFPHLNVYSNMAFGMRLRKVPKAEVEQRVRQTAQLLGIEAVMQRRPKELSGGQRQRVALARAILSKPQILLLDDPLSALDVHTEGKVTAALAAVLTSTTALIVAHRPSTVQLADRVALLQGGVITAIGRHTELLATEPRYRYLMSAETSDPAGDDGRAGPGLTAGVSR
jgi:multiple sugar transport system ATP-binding protein